MFQIFNKDCLEALKRAASNQYDLILCDPPYFDYKTGHRKDKASKLSKGMLQQTREDMITVMLECIRVLKEDRAFFVFTNWEQDWWLQQQLGTLLRNKIIWDKGNWSAGDLKGSFGNKYEVILLGAKGKWDYKGKREHDIWGENNSLPRMGTDRIHPTEKPVSLYTKIIENATDEGAWILDPYMGSASSGEAAIRLGRNYIGYELDEHYFKLNNERLTKVSAEVGGL